MNNNKFWNFIYSLKNPKILAILGIFIVAAAVPLTVFIAQRQQNLQQKASVASCSVKATPNGNSVIGEVTWTIPPPPQNFARKVKWVLDPGGSQEQIKEEINSTTTFSNLPVGNHLLHAEYTVVQVPPNVMGAKIIAQGVPVGEISPTGVGTPSSSPVPTVPDATLTATLTTVPTEMPSSDCGTVPFTITTESGSPTTTPTTPPVAQNGLNAYFFNQKDPGVNNAAVFTRIDPNINFNWNNENGLTGVTKSLFSVRWEGALKINAQDAGVHYFYARVDDGVKLWVNNQLIINDWVQHTTPINKTSTKIVLQEGTYTIKMEYFEKTAARETINHIARLRWSKGQTAIGYDKATLIPNSQLFTKTPIIPPGSGTPTFTPTPIVPQDSTGIKADYFNNITLNGDPKLTRIDSNINYDWDSLAAGDTLFQTITKSKFSVRWTTFIKPKITGNYYLYTRTDDGVRLKIDGQTVINNWTEHSGATAFKTATAKKLEQGKKYKIVMEYFEKTAAKEKIDHVARLRWSKGAVSTTFANAELIPNDVFVLPEGTGNTSLSLDLVLQYTSISSEAGKISPKNKERDIIVCIYRLSVDTKNDNDCKNATIKQTGKVIFNQTMKDAPHFTNSNFTLDSPIPPGQYQVLVKTDKYLRRKATGAQSILAGVNQITPITMTPGDINDLNVVDINSYNTLIDCGTFDNSIPFPNDKYNSSKCSSHPSRADADLDDDGIIDATDLTIFAKSINTLPGD